jgi:hypothetical protein
MTTRAWGIAVMIAAAVGGTALFYSLALSQPTISPWSGAVAGATSALFAWGLVLVVTKRYRKRVAIFAAFVTLWGIAIGAWVASALSD